MRHFLISEFALHTEIWRVERKGQIIGMPQQSKVTRASIEISESRFSEANK